MSTIDSILGRKPVLEDEPPVQAARPHSVSPYRKLPPRDAEEKKLLDKARRSSVIAHIIGMAEGDEEGIIPPEATQIDQYSLANVSGSTDTPKLDNGSPSEPSLAKSNGAELIPPTAALVAPDVTPKIFELIDPSQVPAPPTPTAPPAGAPAVTAAPTGDKGALDTILARQNPSPDVQPVTAESFMQTISPLEIKSKVAEKLVPASEGGSSMPDHKPGDGRTIFNVTRSLLG